MTTKLLLALGFLIVSPNLFATTTIIFSGTGGTLSGFGNASGTPTNGMRWGIVIDTAGDGFDNGALNMKYAAFDNAINGFIQTTNTLTNVTTASDDYFFTSGSFPVTQDDTTPGAGETGTQVAAITSAVGAPNGTDGVIPGVNTGDAYSVIWFPVAPTDGSAYGLFNHASFTLIASGPSDNKAANFSGNDTPKTASFTFASVPEPSRALLLGFGALGLMFRRRRA